MKTLGLIGGMSWESTVSYYKALNQGINQRLGGLHSAKVLLSSVDFYEIERLQHKEQWDDAADLLLKEAKALENAGAQGLVICTNTMHKVADYVSSNISIPLIHIVDATAEALQKSNIDNVALLGTKFTMEQPFYSNRLHAQFGIKVVIPTQEQRDMIHSVIYNQLCKGMICKDSRKQYIEVINALHEQGAQGVILGCTEIALLIKQEHTNVPVFDTTAIHAEKAVTFMLDG